MLVLFYSYSLLQEALASRRITIVIARPGGILSLSNGYEESDELSGCVLCLLCGLLLSIPMVRVSERSILHSIQTGIDFSL